MTRFLPYQGGWALAPPLLRELEVVGSDLDNFGCPRCEAHDRERHLYLYMDRKGIFQDLAGKAVVHFAPERHLSARIRATEPASYVACDLFPTTPDIQLEDMLAMSFDTASVDLLIANHVLEHVPDAQAAVAEVARVLKPGGHAILQTPYCPMLERTWEDAGVRSPSARLHAYGQEDHVRMFGRDIFALIEAAGLTYIGGNHDDLLPDVDPQISGVNAREPFFLFKRR